MYTQKSNTTRPTICILYSKTFLYTLSKQSPVSPCLYYIYPIHRKNRPPIHHKNTHTRRIMRFTKNCTMCIVEPDFTNKQKKYTRRNAISLKTALCAVLNPISRTKTHPLYVLRDSLKPRFTKTPHFGNTQNLHHNRYN